MNQSELEAKTCSRRQARENACEQVTIGFGFTSDWFEKMARDFLANHKAKQCKTKAIARLLSAFN